MEQQFTDGRSYSLLIGAERVGIRHENRRLYKFCSWLEAKPILENFISDRLVQAEPALGDRSHFKLIMKSVNPMRRSMFGNFYLDVDGEVQTLDGVSIGQFSEFGLTHINLKKYDTHDEIEISKRDAIESKFGKDQYSKELSMRTQAVDHVVDLLGGSVTLDVNDPDSIDDFIKECLALTGWSGDEDNRLHSRLKRVPSWMEIPE